MHIQTHKRMNNQNKYTNTADINYQSVFVKKTIKTVEKMYIGTEITWGKNTGQSIYTSKDQYTINHD